jgi:hypothetical protein
MHRASCRPRSLYADPGAAWHAPEADDQTCRLTFLNRTLCHGIPLSLLEVEIAAQT